jgi:arylsulfatase A-like enzyme
MHAKEQDIAKYKGKYDGGYEPIRRARLERGRQLGLLQPGWDLSPQWGDWDAVPNKAWEARCMEVYAAMVDCMDQGIGRIAADLKNSGQWDNTLIFFLQDNGGCAEDIGRKGHVERPAQPTLPPIAPDALRQDVIPKQNRAGIPTLQGPDVMPGAEDTYISYGQAWANVSNTPFREYKHWVHEGGISTPLIAHWPGGIDAALKNKIVSVPGHLIDIMATCVDLSGATYPSEFKGEKIRPAEGVSLRPVFEGKKLERPNPLFWEHEGNRAVRIGPWKLVAKGPAGAWELYDMTKDRTEMHNLAAEQPERVKELVGIWEAWAKRANVLPWIWKPPYGQTDPAPETGKKRSKKKK